jgi:ribosomal protein L11 methyltransferase
MPSAKSTWYLQLSVSADRREPVDLLLYSLDFLGSQEEEIDETVKMQVYFSTSEDARRAYAQFTSLPGVSLTAPAEQPGQDWNAAWRSSMEPVCIGGNTWVSPEWLPPPINEGQHWIRIEPKMAFGTGHHETTRLASQALFDSGDKLRQRRFLDVGSGSGVLCFVARLCGASFSLGVEIDGDCRGNLAENRDANPGEGRVSFVIGTLDGMKGEALFDVCAMNMIATHSLPLLGTLARLLRPGGMLIWGGILIDQHAEIVAAASAAGLTLTGATTENEWWCGVFSCAA